MAEIAQEYTLLYRQQWRAEGCPVPLEVARSRYDDVTVSWSVLWHDSLWDGNGGCSSPIAEFTTWIEAHLWAEEEGRRSKVYRLGRQRIVGPMPKPWGWRLPEQEDIGC